MSFLLRFQDLPQYYKHNLLNLLFHTTLFKSIYDPKTECPSEFNLRTYTQKFLDEINTHHPLYSKCIFNKDNNSFECFIFCMPISNIQKVFKDILTISEHHKFLKILISENKSDEVFLILGYECNDMIRKDALQSCLNETLKSVEKDYNLSDISIFSTYDNNDDINSIYKSFNHTFSNLCTSLHKVEDNFNQLLLSKSPQEEKENNNKILNPFLSQKSHIKLEWCTSKQLPREAINADNPYQLIKNLKTKNEKEKENYIEEIKGIELIGNGFFTDPCLFFMISGCLNKPERIIPSDYSEDIITNVNRCGQVMIHAGIESYAAFGNCLFAKSIENDNELVGGLAFSIFDSREAIDHYEISKYTDLYNGVLRNKNVSYFALIRGIYMEYHYKFIREAFVGKNSEYIYIHMLAIFSDVQGKGYGSELMKAIIKYSEIFHLKILLETHKYENVSFYQKFGFVVKNIDEGYYFYKLPKAYMMIREPE